MTIKTFRCSDDYLAIIATIMEKRQFRYVSEAIRFGLDLAKLKLRGAKAIEHDIKFVSPKQKTEQALEWKLAAKLSMKQLRDYQDNYEPKKISIAEYCKIKDLLQEYF